VEYLAQFPYGTFLIWQVDGSSLVEYLAQFGGSPSLVDGWTDGGHFLTEDGGHFHLGRAGGHFRFT